MKELIISQSWDVIVAGLYFIIWGIAYGFGNSLVLVQCMFSKQGLNQNFIGKIGDSIFYVAFVWLIISFI
ncbi:hypothetical protein HPMBJEAJ_00136 [Aeromonas phage avDM6]|nr:hypothetical protein HPMBJEAJ_00136 [Aeromonas phage avDM6]